MQTLNYKTPAGEEHLKKALDFCENGIAGAEMYTFLRLEGKNIPEGRFFCAENEQGETVSAVFLNGDLTVTKQEGVSPYPGLCVMAYRGAPPPEDPALTPAGLRETLAFYRAQGEGTLTAANEARYVYRARALRDGLALGFCVKEDGAPVSFAYITAQNKNAALIGDVFTLPPYRGRGYARRNVLACAREAVLSGKKAYIVCKEETAGFYLRMGFERMRNSGCGLRN